VVEFFWFGCGHCFTLEALLNDWKKELPSSVDFYRYPVIWNKTVETHAKIFFIAEALKKPEIVNGVFNAIHIRQKMLSFRQRNYSFSKDLWSFRGPVQPIKLILLV
jgi:thiol:disulfide interchange protein DsbA